MEKRYRNKIIIIIITIIKTMTPANASQKAQSL